MDSAKYKSNIWKFYLASFIGGFTYFYNSIETLFYRHFNLSFEQIGVLISSMLLATILLEVPTGSFADIYGRKKSLVIGSVIGLIALTILALGSDFNTFLVGFTLLGVMCAFKSGAWSALLYDSLHKLGQSEHYIKHQSRINSIYISIDILAGSLGFFLFAINVRVPFYISIIAMLALILVQMSMQEELIKRVYTSHLKLHLNQIKNAFFVIIQSKIILWLIFFSALIFVTGRFFADVLSTPFLQEFKKLTIYQLGILALISNTIQAIFVFNADKIEKRLGKTASLISVILFISFSFLVTLLSENYLISSIFIGLYYASWSFSEIITESYVNQIATSDLRATIMSLNSMVYSLLGFIFLPILGLYLDKSGLYQGLQMLTIITFTLGLILLSLKNLLKPRKT